MERSLFSSLSFFLPMVMEYRRSRHETEMALASEHCGNCEGVCVCGGGGGGGVRVNGV